MRIQTPCPGCDRFIPTQQESVGPMVFELSRHCETCGWTEAYAHGTSEVIFGNTRWCWDVSRSSPQDIILAQQEIHEAIRVYRVGVL